MHRLIICGSPRSHGRSAALTEALFDACMEDCPEDGVSVLSVASLDISGCMGCDACQKKLDEPCYAIADLDDPLAPCARSRKSDAAHHRCVVRDDMDEVRKHLDAAHELIIVTPVYFSSVPSQLKALLDRLQPYFWSNARHKKLRPCTIHVVGEGSDPFGYEGLIEAVSSAVLCAGFRVERFFDWVGRIDRDGTITADADEYAIGEDEPEGETQFLFEMGTDDDAVSVDHGAKLASEAGVESGTQPSSEAEPYGSAQPAFGAE